MMIFFALSLNPAAVLTDSDCGAASFFTGSDSGTSVRSILAPHSPQSESVRTAAGFSDKAKKNLIVKNDVIYLPSYMTFCL